LQLQNVAHNTHCTQQNNQCLLNKTAKCPPPAATHAWSLFRHSPTALSIMCWSSLSRSSAIRRRWSRR